jgi:HK97 family phage prohead protease
MPTMTLSEEETDIQFKTRAGQVNIDNAKGIVECFVAAIGNKDSVGDIIIPGAFDASLKRRKPRVVWGHNWNEPIGKILDIFEVPPKDRRLPPKMFKAGVGGLFAKVQFNLNAERGKEAFANVAFFGEEQEWSIGYKTIDADYDHTHQANILKEVELYECSPVLHGANQLTSTISVKDNKESECGRDGELCAVKDLTSELEPQEPALAVLLAEAVKVAFDQEIELVDFDDNRAIVSKGDEAWVVGYHFDETNSEFLFAQPKQVVLETVVRVVGEEVKDGCECGGSCGGCGGAKVLEADAETKVGRKISSRNVTKIAQVVEVLQSIINEVMPSEGPLERKDPVEEKAFIPGKYSEFSDSISFECISEDEIVDVVEALSGVGVPVRFPTPELFAAGIKTLDVLMPIENQEEFVNAMGKALSNVESLKE